MFAFAGMMLAQSSGVAFALGEDTRALLDTLVKKGLITNQEAAEIATRARKDSAEDGGDRIRMKSWIEDLTLFGDARTRYEFREGQSGFAPGSSGGPSSGTQGDTFARERFRYRLRFGALAKFTDDFMMGLRLETSANNRSTNVTFGDDGGPFGKGSDGIFVGQAYANWAPADWATLVVGKMPNPLMTSSMVWDPDLNPEGAAEKIRFAVNDRVVVFAAFGQFLYDEARVNNPLGKGGIRKNLFMFANQIGAEFELGKDVSLAAAPTVYVYAGSGDRFAAATTPNFTGDDTTGAALDRLLVVEIPLELKWRMFDQPWKIFADFAVNADGKARAHLARDFAGDRETYAYQIGVVVGSTAKKGDWEAKVFRQRTGLYALDPNLVDADLFDSRLNMEGFALSLGYAFTDFLSGTITYARADRIEKNLLTSAPGDLTGLNPLNDYQLLQLDLNFRF